MALDYEKSNQSGIFKLTLDPVLFSWLYVATVLSCPLIGCLANERANKRAAQNNYYIGPDFGVPGFVILKL